MPDASHRSGKTDATVRSQPGIVENGTNTPEMNCSTMNGGFNTAGAARPSGLFAYLLDADRVVLGAARSNAGNLADWIARVFRLDGDIVAEVVTRRPGSHGLEAVPALAGERSPDWPAVASGSLSGLRPDTTAVDAAQALLEAAAAGLADSVDSLEQVDRQACTL